MKFKNGYRHKREGTTSRFRDRVMLAPFWKVSDWGLSFWPFHHVTNFLFEGSLGPLSLVGKGGDEWENPSFYIIIPLVGEIVFFYGKNFDRSTWWLSGRVNNTLYYISPDGLYEASIDFDRDNWEEEKSTLTHGEIAARAKLIEFIE